MPQIQEGNNYVDIRKIIEMLVSKWLLFVISIGTVCIAAILFLKTSTQLYPIRSSIQVIDQNTDKTAGIERFISGQELMAGNPEIEDEIGILSSYSILEKALDSLNFNVSCYRYRPELGFIGKSLAKEIYKEGLDVILDTAHIQLINSRFYISFPDESHYRIKADISDGVAYGFARKKTVQRNVNISIDETLPLGKPFKSNLLHFTIVLDSLFDSSSPYDYFFEIRSTESIVKSYASKLKITPISKGSNIVNVTINGSLPEKEIDFLNALGREYIRNDWMNENQLGLKTIEFIDDQLMLIYDSLELVETNLKAFRQANRIVDIPTSSSNYNAQLEQLEEEQAKILVQQKYLIFTLENLKKNEEIIDAIAPSSVGLNDAFLNNLMLQLSDLNKEKISKSYSSGPNSLTSQVLSEKIENTKGALRENVNNLLSSTRISLQENKRRMNRILSSIGELPQSERDLIKINRKFSFNDNVYNYLLEKRVEAGIALASNLPDKRIIDKARLESNEPVSPNKKLIMLGAMAIGFTFPFGLILIQQFMDTRLSDPKKIENGLGAPVIGTFHHIKRKDSKKLVTFQDGEQVKEAFRYLLVDLRQDLLIPENKTIGITSFENGDGKTFCAANLAATFASAGHLTLLIDADIHTTTIPKAYFQSANQKEGLMHYLANQLDIKPFIRDLPFKNLHYIPLGVTVPATEKTMINYEKKMTALFDQLKVVYDVIIIDTPAISKSSDYLLLSHLFSVNILVTRHKKTSNKVIDKMTPHLLRKKIRNLKIVYNDVPVTSG